MYLYFDKWGGLKEIINDDIARVGNQNWNIIYAYWDNTAVKNTAYITYLLPDGTKTIPYEKNAVVNQEIPFDKTRDLMFFEYYKSYSFYKFIVPDNVLDLVGSVLASIKFTTATENVSMANVCFKVDGTSRFLPEEHINSAEFGYFERLVGQISSLLAGQIPTTDITSAGSYLLQATATQVAGQLVKTLSWVKVPPLPSEESEATYVLKAIRTEESSGWVTTLEWVEEEA